jgi:ribonucleotide reductase alpha subunit
LIGCPYQSEKEIELAGKIMSRIQRYAEDALAELAEKRGNFPSFDHGIFPSRA